MQSIILMSLLSLTVCSRIDTYNEYQVFATKNHIKSVSQYAETVGFAQFNSQWEEYKINFNKIFDQNEEERKFNYLNSLQFIKSHNEKFDAGLVTHRVDINQFSDWSAEEYQSMMGAKPIANLNITMDILKLPPVASLPSSFDWRSQGKVTPVKNQGQCGSCWAFATVGSIESAYLINNNQEVLLSEQELVDCSSYNQGCSGGWAAYALSFVKQYGLETESQYPYYEQQGYCQYNQYASRVQIRGYYQLDQPCTDQDMMSAIMNYGPVIVAINSEGNDFAHYRSGIINSGNRQTTHMVMVVGWGPGYWIIKNSWATSWGLNGFGYIAQGYNVRGINSAVYLPAM